MKKNISWAAPQTVSLLVQALRNNELVVSTTDTILGLLAPLTQIGFEKLNAVKGRQEKPYLMVMSDAHKLAHFVDEYPSFIQPILDHCWPGPLTIVFKARKDLPEYIVSKEGTIALRVPQHSGLLALLTHFDDGLFSTSANISGQPVALMVSEIAPTIQEAVSYIVAGESSVDFVRPSTIIDCTQEKIKVLREGAYDVNFLKKISGADIFE